MDNFATWMMNGGRDPLEVPSDRDLIHRRAIREALAAADGRVTLVGRLSAFVRSFRNETAARPEAACCVA